MPTPILEATSICKSFGPTRALHNVSLRLFPGQIHALLGENGAGKSTLVSILSGGLQADAGEIRLDGELRVLASARQARALGIALVHQHFSLIPAFTVAENILLANSSTPGSLRTVLSACKDTLRFAERLGWKMDANARVRDLSVGEQQRVEIVRALEASSRVALFDEPTATLTETESSRLFELMRTLKSEGRASVLITHKLREVMAVADVVTVLRNGESVLSAVPISECTEQMLAHAMVGEFQQSEKPPRLDAAGAVSVSELSVRGDRGTLAVRRANFRVEFGSIFGIAGVDGNGQIELAEALAGIRQIESGQIEFGDHSENPVIAYIPQNRLVDGLAPLMSVEDNLMIEGHKRADLRSGPFVSPKRTMEWRQQLMDRFDIKSEGQKVPVATLSGGNQQKIVIARLLDRKPDVVIAVDPTRGLDVRAAAAVRERLAECAHKGSCVILFSSDLDELQSIAHRIVVMSNGAILEGDDLAMLMGGAA